jgi:hypothetical protein
MERKKKYKTAAATKPNDIKAEVAFGRALNKPSV